MGGILPKGCYGFSGDFIPRHSTDWASELGDRINDRVSLLVSRGIFPSGHWVFDSQISHVSIGLCLQSIGTRQPGSAAGPGERKIGPRASTKTSLYYLRSFDLLRAWNSKQLKLERYVLNRRDIVPVSRELIKGLTLWRCPRPGAYRSQPYLRLPIRSKLQGMWSTIRIRRSLQRTGRTQVESQPGEVALNFLSKEEIAFPPSLP
jgi:hypothetical protein